MIPTPELSAKIALWRRRAAENTLSVDELKEAIAALRGPRRSAAEASDASRRKKAVTAIPDANSLLDEI